MSRGHDTANPTSPQAKAPAAPLPTPPQLPAPIHNAKAAKDALPTPPQSPAPDFAAEPAFVLIADDDTESFKLLDKNPSSSTSSLTTDIEDTQHSLACRKETNAKIDTKPKTTSSGVVVLQLETVIQVDEFNTLHPHPQLSSLMALIEKRFTDAYKALPGQHQLSLVFLINRFRYIKTNNLYPQSAKDSKKLYQVFNQVNCKVNINLDTVFDYFRQHFPAFDLSSSTPYLMSYLKSSKADDEIPDSTAPDTKYHLGIKKLFTTHGITDPKQILFIASDPALTNAAAAQQAISTILWQNTNCLSNSTIELINQPCKLLGDEKHIVINFETLIRYTMEGNIFFYPPLLDFLKKLTQSAIADSIHIHLCAPSQRYAEEHDALIKDIIKTLRETYKIKTAFLERVFLVDEPDSLDAIIQQQWWIHDVYIMARESHWGFNNVKTFYFSNEPAEVHKRAIEQFAANLKKLSTQTPPKSVRSGLLSPVSLFGSSMNITASLTSSNTSAKKHIEFASDDSDLVSSLDFSPEQRPFDVRVTKLAKQLGQEPPARRHTF